MTLIIKTVKVRINYIHRFDFGPINIGNKVWRSENFSTLFLSVLIWPNNDKIISCQNTLNLFYNRQWLYQDTLMVNTVHLYIWWLYMFSRISNFWNIHGRISFCPRLFDLVIQRVKVVQNLNDFKTIPMLSSLKTEDYHVDIFLFW